MNDITEVKVQDCTLIFTNSDSYTRYGEDCWFIAMGESDESVYDCASIEDDFQEYIKDNDIDIRTRDELLARISELEVIVDEYSQIFE